jgi:hypothetical protein
MYFLHKLLDFIIELFVCGDVIVIVVGGTLLF